MQVAAQAPPVAAGLLQETTYMHSGEVETSASDLDAGGRAGWNVTIDRSYRSRAIGISPLAYGWDSTIFRRLRVLPKGDIEYRDGTGEIWLFRRTDTEYEPPPGYYVKLARSGSGGYTLIDQSRRVSFFDHEGKLVSEADEFYDAARPNSGNVIHYVYGADGRLARIIDPVGRETKLSYSEAHGHLEQVIDWRGRSVRYGYDRFGRLESVQLPEVGRFRGDARPTFKYGYPSASLNEPEQVTDFIDVGTNLTGITIPDDVPYGRAPRVSFSYETAGANRDRVKEQKWATGETASFVWDSASTATSIDVLGQVRKYTLATPSGDRAHISELREIGVPVWAGAEAGQIPTLVIPGQSTSVPVDRVHRYTYANGAIKTSTTDGVREVANTLVPAPGVKGFVLQSTEARALHGHTPLAASQSTITTRLNYQAGTTFLASVAANGAQIETTQPHRDALTPQATNDSVVETDKYDANGQWVGSSSSGGTDPGSAGAESAVTYHDENDAAPYKRGLPKSARTGGAENLVTEYRYPDESQVIEIDPRGLVTITEVDEWQRPISVRRLGPDRNEETEYEYDSSGRLITQRSLKDPASPKITTSYTYDSLGRQLSSTVDGVATESGTMSASTTYELTNHEVTVYQSGGSSTETTLDSLGRATKRVTLTGSSPIEERYAYDLAGNRVFVSDNVVATALAFDAHGRLLATRGSDGTVSAQEYDAWGNATKQTELDDSSTPAVIAETSMDVSASGRLRQAHTKVDAATTSSTQYAWDGAGRTTSVANGGRAGRSVFDAAGRMKKSMSGAGDLSAMSDVFEKTEVSAFDGMLPTNTTTTEKNGSTTVASMVRGVNGEVTSQKVGDLSWRQTYDSLGQVTEAAVPGRPGKKFDVDSRGATRRETLEDGASTNQFAYAANGAQKEYKDPASEATSTDTDLIGRPLVRRYADGTTERIEWEGARVKAVTDRQQRKQKFTYNGKGQLSEVRDGNDVLIDLLTYDSAARLTSWKTADSEVTWEDFDLAGHPRKTRQKRFRNGGGLSPSAEVLDEYVSEHRWDQHGQRVMWSMPRTNTMTIGAGWTKWVREQYDAAGNLVLVGRLDDANDSSAVALMTASFKSAGRPLERVMFPNAGITPSTPAPIGATQAIILRSYGYDASTGQMNKLAVAVNGVDIAGSEIKYDGLQISEARLLGVSAGERVSKWTYDLRSRLRASLAASARRDAELESEATRGRAKEQLSAADFRNAQERTPQLDAATRGAMLARGVDPSKVDPPSMTLAERAGGGHKIETVTKGAAVRTFGYSGAEVIDDGRFIYEFNAKGQLIRATEKTPSSTKRRISYFYSGPGRLVGRRAEYTTVADPSPQDWKLEDRTYIINADGLAADVTLVWDAITDRINTVARAAAQPADPHGGLLKQIIHGGLGYDDPLETATVDAQAGGEVKHLYPVYDEVGAGALQAVIGEKGEVLARNISTDPFGGEDVAVSGPAIDQVTVSAKKDRNGVLQSVTVALRATESLAAATVASGARLASVDAQGSVVRTATTAPSLDADNAYAVEWTLTPAEWTALTSTSAGVAPTALSIAATDSLRASAWGANVPVLTAPEWAVASRPVFTSPALPMEVRESLASLSTFLAGIPPDAERSSALYEAETLGLAAGGGSDESLDEFFAARMHAHPFTDPATRLNYVRARWYDATTGSWLSPDPKGYVDSSNLYAFCGGDPINCSDPTGEAGVKETALSVLGWGAGVLESASDMVISASVVGTARQVKQKYERVKRIADAYQQAGVRSAAGQYIKEWTGASTDILKTLPGVNTVRAGIGVPDAYAEGSFEGGRQVGRTTFSLAGDATLVYGGARGVQQMRASRTAPVSTPAAASAKPQWLKDVEAGANYNKARAFDYPYREVYLEKPSGSGYYRLDAYDPLAGEIVSRKMTQLSQISESTGVGYVHELATKYPAGAKIAKVPSSGPLAGQSLRGQLILEVPVQGAAIPERILNAARARGVVIRDVHGRIY